MVEKDCRGLVVVGGEVTFGGEMTQTGFGGGGWWLAQMVVKFGKV